jgi:hypothetical protein
VKRSLFFLWLALSVVLILVGTGQAVRDTSQVEITGSTQEYGAAVGRTATATPAPTIPTSATHEHRGDGSGHPTETPLPLDSPLDPLSDF